MSKAVIALGNREVTAGLTFVCLTRVESMPFDGMSNREENSASKKRIHPRG